MLNNQPLVWDETLLKRYDRNGPRYTSYPTAAEFHDGFGVDAFIDATEQASKSDGPLSLYIHIPFCAKLCFYCACNKVVTKRRELAEPYLEALLSEATMQAKRFGHRKVNQLHIGGGTPTFISAEQMRQLMDDLAELFELNTTDGEFSIEIDPREIDEEYLEVLAECGFNRISLGVQDLDEKVQIAVNRVQPIEQTEMVVNKARELGFKSISFDLIYGLPHQSQASFAATVEKVIELSPDRLSVFNYAHLPTRFMPQRRIKEEDLPAAADKLAILQNTAKQLMDAGYQYIGMDHFAKPDDELAVAQQTGTLQRNFQGYSTHADCDLIGLGVSSISQVGDCYSQNVKDTDSYYAAIENGELPLERGVTINRDDRIRHDVIMQLICHYSLDIDAVKEQWGIDFDQYFKEELFDITEMAKDGLLVYRQGHEIEVLAPGMLLIRNICMVFDTYRRQSTGQIGFSKVI